MKKQSIENLTELIEKKLLNSTDLALYVYLAVHSGEAVSLRILQKRLAQSVTSIVHHIAILELLQLISIARIKKPRKHNVYTVKDLSKERVLKIVSDKNTYLSQIERLKDSKIGKYHPKALSVHTGSSLILDINNNISIEEEGKCTDELSEPLKYVLRKVPEEFATTVIVRPQQIHALQVLNDDTNFDLQQYVKWFMDRKLGITVDRFSLGIFLYPGMITEFKTKQLKKKKSNRYKAKNKVPESDIQKKKKKLEEELYGKGV